MAEGGFEKKLKARELVAIGLGAVVGWSWIVYGGLWSTVGGSLGGVLAFFITGLLCCLVGLVYAELTSAYPKAGGDIVFAFEGLGVKASLVTMWCMLVFWIGLIMIECMMIPVIMSRLGFAIPQICPLYDIAGGTVYLSYVIVSLQFNLLFAFLNVKGTQLASGVQTAAVYLLLAGAVCSLPLVPALQRRLGARGADALRRADGMCYGLCAVLLALCLTALAAGGFAPFIYFQF